MSDKVLYTASAHVDGGRADGHGKTSDGHVDVDFRLPGELGGDGAGTNPEQLFALGYAACFDGAVGVIGRREKADVENAAIDAKVNLHPTPERGFSLSVELDVHLPNVPDKDEAKRIVKLAHEVCPYSNATRGNIPVTISVDGEPIE